MFFNYMSFDMRINNKDLLNWTENEFVEEEKNYLECFYLARSHLVPQANSIKKNSIHLDKKMVFSLWMGLRSPLKQVLWLV